MKGTLDIKDIQNINLFEKVTGIKARCCFDYNSVTIFAVPQISIKRISGDKFNFLQNKIGKLRIIAMPESQNESDLTSFITNLIYPLTFKRLELNGNELSIYAHPKVKARLIGKDKIRLKELSEAIEMFFNIEKIVIK
jgi:hypothetical protein